MSTNDLVDIQIKLSWQDEKIEALSSALVEKEKRIGLLEEQVARLERAMQILAQRQSAPAAEIAGKHDVDDPVPRSG
jgi:uncharacterized coiled-coil protein SlyX